MVADAGRRVFRGAGSAVCGRERGRRTATAPADCGRAGSLSPLQCSGLFFLRCCRARAALSAVAGRAAGRSCSMTAIVAGAGLRGLRCGRGCGSRATLGCPLSTAWGGGRQLAQPEYGATGYSTAPNRGFGCGAKSEAVSRRRRLEVAMMLPRLAVDAGQTARAAGTVGEKLLWLAAAYASTCCLPVIPALGPYVPQGTSYALRTARGEGSSRARLTP